MVGEYRITKGWRIFIYIFATPLILLFVYTGILPFTQNDINIPATIVVEIFAIAMIGLFGYGLIDVIHGKFIIGKDHVSLVNPLGTRTLKFTEIKGYSVNNNYVYIIPIRANQKKIKITTYTEKSDEIISWLAKNFTECDKVDRAEEETRILSSDEFQTHKPLHEKKLADARRFSRITNAAGFVVGFLLMLYPRPYAFSITVGMLYPIIIITLMYWYRGFLKIEEKRNSAYPSVFTGFMMVSLGLMLRGLLDFNILEYQRLWIAVAILSTLLFFFLLILNGGLTLKKAEDYFSLLGVMVIVFTYTFGAYSLANCIHDKSQPQTFESEIIDKEISTGKATIYYLTVAPWENQTEPEKIKVSEEDYHATAVGEYVTIYQMEGLFKTPWYFVTR